MSSAIAIVSKAIDGTPGGCRRSIQPINTLLSYVPCLFLQGLESVNDEESPPPPISGDVSLIQHEEGADEMKKPKVTVEVGGGRLVDGFAEQSTAEEGPVAFAVGRFDDSVAVMQAKKGDRTTSTTLSSATPGHDDEVENDLDDDGERRAATEEYGNSNSNIVAHEQDVRTTR